MIYEYPVIFYSDGIKLVGRFFRNDDRFEVRQPAVVITGSWLTVKEQMPALYAKQLAERGYTAFIFDFAGFGESGGEPRQLEMPTRKIRDILSAWDFVAAQSFVSPGKLGHLAICASAQYALSALTRSSTVAAFASVAGWYHNTETVSQFYGGMDGVHSRMKAASEAMDDYIRSGKARTVPAYAPGDEEAGMFFELDYYGNPSRGAIAEWKNEMAVMSWFYWLAFDGLQAASLVDVPTVMVHGDGCVLPDNARQVHSQLRKTKDLVWVDGFQVDFYDQPDLVATSLKAVDDHFRETLRPS